MTPRMELLKQLAEKNEAKIILLVLDGVGEIHTVEKPKTALELARTPNLDALAERSALGRIIPADFGITPGSGPGHLALFGYDPLEPKHQIGRGALEALGINYDLKHGEIAARGNFTTMDKEGKITDRRAGRPSTDECRRVSELLDQSIGQIDGVTVRVLPVKEHRFCVMLHSEGLSPDIADTDPQETGVPPLKVTATKKTREAERTREIVEKFVERSREILKNEPKINGMVLRGFAGHPGLPAFQELYRLTPAAVAAYPLYLGVARLAGMAVLKTGESPREEFETVARNWSAHDFFFIHIKKTDSSGEDGNQDAKKAAIESVDQTPPILLDLKPDVIAITGDHCTPHTMRAHSWHPVPLLISGASCDIDGAERFTESDCACGGLGTFPSSKLLGLLLANAGKLAKFGA